MPQLRSEAPGSAAFRGRNTFQATTCTIPPLAAGTYKVDVVGDGPHAGLPDRELVVTADGATSCKLPGPPNEPKPIPDSDAREYATDDDCAIATIGSVCAPGDGPACASRASSEQCADGCTVFPA